MTSPRTDALLSLLEQLRGASRLGRAKVLTQAVAGLRGLTVQERRDMAVEVARQVAPELLPSMEETGGHLSPALVSRFVDLAQRMESDDIAAVASALRTGDLDDPSLREAVSSLTTSTLDVLAPPTAPAIDMPETETEVEEEVEPQLQLPSETLAPDGSEASPTDGGHEPDPEPEDLADALLAAEADAEVTNEALVRAAEVAAAPDGWRRRRLLLDFVREGQIADEEAALLVATLARLSDRAWVVGALLDEGLATLDDVAPLLDERAAHRLRARMAA